MILTMSIMLVPLLVIPMVLAFDISLHGANNVWISSNVRSLGCYSPFEPSLSIMMTITNHPDQIDFANCNYCGLSDFVLVRGAQCTCINNDIVANQMRISDTYCNIPCDQDPFYDGNEVFMCGGNLGGSLYCNKQSGNNCLNANFNGTSFDIYRDFGIDRSGDFQSLEPCLNLGCGSRPNPADHDNLSYFEYFPNLNPEDCVVFCTYVNTSYAHAGWQTQEIDGNIDLYPMCICSNITMPADPEGLPCTNGTCPSIFDPVDELTSLSCGNKQTVNDNWSVYCTTMVVTSEVNGTTSCAPYQPMPLTNDSLETCWAFLASTEGIKSSMAIPVTPEEKCAFGRKSKGMNLVKDGMRFECRDDCTSSNCCKCGNCGNVTSCSFNGSCYDISSDSSDNHNGTVDTWRTILADKCTKDHPGGHLVAIESQSEHEFISQVLSEASDEKSPVLSSGILNDDGEFWVLSESQQFPISEDAEDWGVKIYRDECDIFPCYLMLVFDNEKNSGYNVWQFTRCSDSFLFVCEYQEPERTTVTPSTTPSTSTTSTTTQATTKPTTCLASTTSPTTSSNTETTSTSSSTLTWPTTTETTSVTTNQPSTTNLKPNLSYENCPCNSTDLYDINWIINANETKYQSCRQGANGQASWTCDLIADYGCRLRTQQPDFSNCQSLELVQISENVQEANNETELYVVWESLRNFTSRVNTYFGHEIDNILDIVTDILNQQDWQMNGAANHLEFQINTTQSGARIIDNLISHSAQWEQLTSQDDRSQKALLLLNVSEDMSFRLTDIAEQDNRSLRCEIYLANVTFSSAYWNGNQTRVDDCDLDSDYDQSQPIRMDDDDDILDIAGSEVFRRFPISDQNSGSSYLLLPEGTIENHRTHKGAGLLISHYILQQLFPGQINTKGYEKSINSPLISYTLRNYDSNDRHLINNQIPKDTFVELVYRHGELAKDPPVRILHRSLNPGETPSAVIGSSFCTFLSFNQSSHEGNQTTSWIWDGQGCMLKSTNRTHTVCQCNHLTGFATLMDFHDYTGESRPLEITSIVCSLASAISLAITFIVLTALRSIKTDRTIITQNLCVFLMFSHVMALTTLNRHYLNLDQVTCAAMGIMLHFSLLVSFMWMAIEGLRLCRMVLYVFNLRDWTLYYVLAAYIVPFIIVSVTVLTAEFTTTIISAYTGDETCWLNGANYKWSFAGPVAVIILVNLIFAMIAVRSSWNLKQNTDRSLEEKIRNAAALLLSLTCLLGISWLTGFLLYAETQVFAYIFTITNGLQGVTIMLFRCFLNDEVRTAIKDRWRRHRNNRIGRWSSTMTTNTSSQRRQSVYTDADSKLKANMKLSQTNSQSSVLSSATKTTDASFITSALTNQHFSDRRQRNVRTFSGTEFSDEYSSEVSESFSSASNTSYRHHPEKKEQSTNNDGFDGVRDARRVSFFIQQNTKPLPSLPNDSPQDNIFSSHNSSETSLVSRRSANQYFYEQDPSAFF